MLHGQVERKPISWGRGQMDRRGLASPRDRGGRSGSLGGEISI